MASGNCWREEQYVRWTKVNFKVLHAAPVQGSHGAFWLAKSSVVVHSSEEGDPVVMSNKQVKELIEKLKQSLKGEI